MSFEPEKALGRFQHSDRYPTPPPSVMQIAGVWYEWQMVTGTHPIFTGSDGARTGPQGLPELFPAAARAARSCSQTAEPGRTIDVIDPSFRSRSGDDTTAFQGIEE